MIQSLSVLGLRKEIRFCVKYERIDYKFVEMDDFQEFSSADYVGGALSRFAYFKLYGINKNSAEPSCQLLQASLYL